MRMSNVVLAVLVLGCGGGGGDGYPSGPGTGSGTGSGPGTGSGSGGGNPSATATVTMRMSDDGYGTATFSFNPASVSIARGGTVTWSHDGAAAVHNVTFAAAAGAPADAGNISTGSVSRTFNTAGSFSYQCTNHPGMTGAVTVQ